MNKKFITISVSIVLVIVVIFLLIFFYTPKDTWMCKDGEWIRKGSPKTSQPKTPCPGEKKGVRYPSSPPEAAVAGFYGSILDSAGENSNDASIFLSKNILKEYEKTVKDGSKDISVFTCSKDNLTNYTIKDHVIQNTKAVVSLILESEGSKKEARVTLITEGGAWKISDIDCGSK